MKGNQILMFLIFAFLTGFSYQNIFDKKLININSQELNRNNLTNASFILEKSNLDVYQNFLNNMVNIEGGSLAMGCEKNYCDIDEKPLHNVKLRSFQMSKYEVTQAQWGAVMGTNPSYNKGCDSCPVENVSWNDIKRFLSEINKQTGKRFRLPTEAEWEFAAKGGSNSLGYFYSGSNYIQNVAWYGDENSKMRTQVVGQLAPNELGLYDMTGNVREWCSDWYGENYYRSSPKSNPRGPGSGLFRVVRGGSMYHGFFGYRVTSRLWENPGNRSRFIGFRLAYD